jgi:hypothetical protein
MVALSKAYSKPNPEWEGGASLAAKKDGTNGLAVRAGRPVTQLTSSSGAAYSHPPSLEYIHHSIDREKCNTKIEILFSNQEGSTLVLSRI